MLPLPPCEIFWVGGFLDLLNLEHKLLFREGGANQDLCEEFERSPGKKELH